MAVVCACVYVYIHIDIQPIHPPHPPPPPYVGPGGAVYTVRFCVQVHLYLSRGWGEGRGIPTRIFKVGWVYLQYAPGGVNRDVWTNHSE